MLKSIASVFWKSGKAYIALYLAFLVAIGLMVANLLFGISSNEIIMKIFGTLILSFLAILVYYELEKKHQSDDITTLELSGIRSYSPLLSGKVLEKLMATPGNIRVLNTWIYNVSELTVHFKEALQHDKTNIEISYLSPKSDFVSRRAEELGLTSEDVANRIHTNRDDLAFFLKNLTPEKRSRVKVFEFDAMPRVLIHTNGERGFVGFFWPETMAVQSPQFFIRGKSQSFPAAVWSYYDYITSRRREVTEELV